MTNTAVKPEKIDALRALLARVEAATGKDRQLDFAVHRVAFPWLATAVIHEIEYDDIAWRKSAHEAAPNSTGWYHDTCGRYTASIDAATALIECVLSDQAWLLSKGRESDEEPLFAVHILKGIRGDSGLLADSEAATLPLAIVGALLSALIAINEASHD